MFKPVLDQLSDEDRALLTRHLVRLDTDLLTLLLGTVNAELASARIWERARQRRRDKVAPVRSAMPSITLVGGTIIRD